MIRSTLLIIPILLIAGCSKDKSSTSPTLTAEQLAKGMGISWWVVEAPEDITMDSLAGLGYRLSDGSEKFFGHSDWWKPKEKAHVFAWTGEDGTFWIRIVRDGVSAPTKLVGPDFEGRVAFFSSSSDEVYKFGEVFAKMGTGKPGEPFSEGDMLYENQIGFFVDFSLSKHANHALHSTKASYAE